MGKTLSTESILITYFPNVIVTIISTYDKEYTNILEYESRTPLPIKSGNLSFDIIDDKIVFLNQTRHIIGTMNIHSNSEGNYNYNRVSYTQEKSTVIIQKNIIITTNMNTNDITIYDHSLNVINTFGTPGIDNSQFNTPTGLCEYDNKIYICDSNNGRIQIFNLELDKLIFLKYINFEFNMTSISEIVLDDDIIYFNEGSAIYSFKNQIKKLIFKASSEIKCFTIENRILFVVLLNGWRNCKLLVLNIDTYKKSKKIPILSDVKQIKIYLNKLYLLCDDYVAIFNCNGSKK